MAEGIVILVELALGLVTVAPDQSWKASPAGAGLAVIVTDVPDAIEALVAPLASVPFTTVSV